MVERPGQAAPATVGFLMRSARAYQDQGNVYQATHAYCDVLDHYPETKQAQEARDRLVKIAQEYERNGQLHTAKHLYRRMDDAIGAQALPGPNSLCLRLTVRPGESGRDEP